MQPDGAGGTPFGSRVGEFVFLYGDEFAQGTLTVVGLLVCLLLSLTLTASAVVVLLHPLLRRLPALHRQARSPAGRRAPERAPWWLGER
ncbi:hypothetical protein GCM10010466_62670 [Planomonospora alba]|uniref:Uncharacterized protein n=1 Tax=Planomonospora alba TaxID=161354 RepID=A0ABP6P076_9ACTN